MENCIMQKIFFLIITLALAVLPELCAEEVSQSARRLPAGAGPSSRAYQELRSSRRIRGHRHNRIQEERELQVIVEQQQILPEEPAQKIKVKPATSLYKKEYFPRLLK